MTDPNLLRALAIEDADVDKAFEDSFGKGADNSALEQIVQNSFDTFTPGSILNGRIVRIEGDNAVIDVGLKSEGIVPLMEWSDRSSVDVGDEVEVWLEAVEADGGLIKLSKTRADRACAWERILTAAKEGDVVRGRVTRKIKGGLLVDIGVPVFLPASQVDIRRTGDAGEYIGREIEAKILKIDPERRNIVISRRKMLEEERETAKQTLLSEIAIGQRRKGMVKNIADFGVFVDLGGIDGLLHITDMSWDRINHPREMVRPEQEIEIVVLNVDKRQREDRPGPQAEERGPLEPHRGEVPGRLPRQGRGRQRHELRHLRQARAGHRGPGPHLRDDLDPPRSTTRPRWSRPPTPIEVVVLDVNKDKQEISLGMKQAEVNPWTKVAEKYPPNTIVEGTVRNLTNYGAFVEIEEGIDGLLHVSDMSWTKKVSHPSELLKKGDQVRCVVLAVDEEKMRIALGLKQLTEDPWLRAIPERYIPGQIVQGKVTKITNFGVFVELEPGLEGLLHISELADEKVEDPHNIVKVGQDLEVKILRVDPAERKIGLSKKRAEWAGEQEGQAPTDQPERRRELRGGLEGPGAGPGRLGQLIDEAGFIRNANKAREQDQQDQQQ